MVREADDYCTFFISHSNKDVVERSVYFLGGIFPQKFAARVTLQNGRVKQEGQIGSKGLPDCSPIPNIATSLFKSCIFVLVI